jgi:hypothetical protein
VCLFNLFANLALLGQVPFRCCSIEDVETWLIAGNQRTRDDYLRSPFTLMSLVCMFLYRSPCLWENCLPVTILISPAAPWVVRYSSLARSSIPAFCDSVYLDSDDGNLTVMLLMAVLATRNLLALTCTTTYQYLGETGVTSNDTNGPESNWPSAGVTLTKFVCGLNAMRTRWIG